MRISITAVVLTVLFLGGLYAAVYYVPGGRGESPPPARQTQGPVGKGFVGSRVFGAWELSCAKEAPAAVVQRKSGAAAANTPPVTAAPPAGDAPTVSHPAPEANPDPESSADDMDIDADNDGSDEAEAAGALEGGGQLGKCRATHAVRHPDDPKKVLMILAFRLVGEDRKPALFLRLPLGAKKGDAVVLQTGDPAKALRLAVGECVKRACLAAAALAPPAWEAILGARPLGVVIPLADGKRGRVEVPVAGLREAVAAMRRAEG